mmetsp:Transcript_36666/g.101238  ORF Transcript_36666/g.101238 Transcript_36666/m.101238 type:complete len:258 (+) Transcript_36666:217-990(+)
MHKQPLPAPPNNGRCPTPRARAAHPLPCPSLSRPSSDPTQHINTDSTNPLGSFGSPVTLAAKRLSLRRVVPGQHPNARQPRGHVHERPDGGEVLESDGLDDQAADCGSDDRSAVHEIGRDGRHRAPKLLLRQAGLAIKDSQHEEWVGGQKHRTPDADANEGRDEQSLCLVEEGQEGRGAQEQAGREKDGDANGLLHDGCYEFAQEHGNHDHHRLREGDDAGHQADFARVQVVGILRQHFRIHGLHGVSARPFPQQPP